MAIGVAKTPLYARPPFLTLRYPSPSPELRRLSSRNRSPRLNLITKNRFEVCLVGGCVRDVIMKRTPKDFDILTTSELREVFIPLQVYLSACRLFDRVGSRTKDGGYDQRQRKFDYFNVALWAHCKM